MTLTWLSDEDQSGQYEDSLAKNERPAQCEGIAPGCCARCSTIGSGSDEARAAASGRSASSPPSSWSPSGPWSAYQRRKGGSGGEASNGSQTSGFQTSSHPLVSAEDQRSVRDQAGPGGAAARPPTPQWHISVSSSRDPEPASGGQAAAPSTPDAESVL